jgi:hypothetical protein
MLRYIQQRHSPRQEQLRPISSLGVPGVHWCNLLWTRNPLRAAFLLFAPSVTRNEQIPEKIPGDQNDVWEAPRKIPNDQNDVWEAPRKIPNDQNDVWEAPRKIPNDQNDVWEAPRKIPNDQNDVWEAAR